jgi:type I restriction enzyme S subunit
MSHLWPKMKLMDLINYKKGFAFKSRDYIQNGIPVIRVTNFTENSISSTDLKFVSHEVAEANHNVALKELDIVIATVGSWPNNPASVVGRTICVPQWASNALMNQNSVILRSNSASTIDQMFIYYQLKSEHFSNYVISKAQGSANQASITLDSIFSYEIHWPSAFERKAIVNILAALDDRISLLRETNTTLEAIAQALFKSWFVDFDPVRAKAEGREPEGIDAETAALFPDSFEESELGLVPKGWRVGKLSDLAKLNPESWTNKNHPDTVLYVDLANAKDNCIGNITQYNFYSAPSRARRVLRYGDTIIGTVRPGNRSYAIIHNAPANLTGSTGFAVLRPIIAMNTEFLYFAATADVSIDYLAHVADGGAYPAVRSEVVANLNVVIPPAEIILAYHLVVQSLLESVSENHQKIQSLATIRDMLLPRLVSGQLRLDVNCSTNMSDIGS